MKFLFVLGITALVVGELMLISTGLYIAGRILLPEFRAGHLPYWSIFWAMFWLLGFILPGIVLAKVIQEA